MKRKSQLTNRVAMAIANVTFERQLDSGIANVAGSRARTFSRSKPKNDARRIRRDKSYRHY